MLYGTQVAAFSDRPGRPDVYWERGGCSESLPLPQGSCSDPRLDLPSRSSLAAGVDLRVPGAFRLLCAGGGEKGNDLQRVFWVFFSGGVFLSQTQTLNKRAYVIKPQTIQA